MITEATLGTAENYADVSFRGKIHKVPATKIEGRTIVVTGKWLKTATIFDEEWQPERVENPDAIINGLRAKSVKADLFTFAQKLPDTQPKFQYSLVWENVAAVPLATYEDWWEKRLPQETRKNVRRSVKRGVTVRAAEFDDALAAGIKKLYDETPVRQGRHFWHYGKSLEEVKRENATYLERSEFIGAYFEDELIGFIKTVYVGQVSIMMQILTLNAHFDKRPTNALIAKAVELAVARRMSHLVYGQYVYGRNNDHALTEFKRRNGFEQIMLPRFYVPLTVKGKAAVACRLHLGLRQFIPAAVDKFLLKARAKVLQGRSVAKSSPAENESAE
jgi:hypothetical protein